MYIDKTLIAEDFSCIMYILSIYLVYIDAARYFYSWLVFFFSSSRCNIVILLYYNIIAYVVVNSMSIV